jgi:hypothetical protein
VNFAFFDSLTTAEAEDYLHQFLAETSRGFEELAQQAETVGLATDYSVQSIAPFMLWVLPQLQTSPVAEDSSVPAWIRQTEEYRDGLYEFTESSRVTVLRSAFYLGESFVRSFPQLRWELAMRTALRSTCRWLWVFSTILSLRRLWWLRIFTAG